MPGFRPSSRDVSSSASGAEMRLINGARINRADVCIIDRPALRQADLRFRLAAADASGVRADGCEADLQAHAALQQKELVAVFQRKTCQILDLLQLVQQRLSVPAKPSGDFGNILADQVCAQRVSELGAVLLVVLDQRR